MSAKNCACCRHGRREEIDRRLLSGESTRSVAAWLESVGQPVGKDGLASHKKHADAPATAPAVEAEPELPDALVDGLTTRQRKFCREYLVDGNATQAAIRAGYAAPTANREGSRLLLNVDIRAAIQHLQAEACRRNDVTVDRIVVELAKLGFSDMGGLAAWGPKGVRFKSSRKLTQAQTAAVASVSEKKVEMSTKDGGEITKTTVTLKLHDKVRALHDLGQHLGMFVNKTELSGAVDLTISSDPAVIRREIEELLAERDKDGPHTPEGNQTPPATAG